MSKEAGSAVDSDAEATTMLQSSSSERSLSSREEEKSHDESEDQKSSDSPTTNSSPRQLKKTCEQCARSKVKCQGSHPCSRCVKRGVDCEFLAEQKRGRRTLMTSDSSPGKKAARQEPEPKRIKSSAVKRPEPPLMLDVSARTLASPPSSLISPMWPRTPFGFAQPFNGFAPSPPTMMHPGLIHGLPQQNLFQPLRPPFPQMQPLVSPPLRQPVVRLLRTLAALYRHRAINGLSGDANRAWFETFFYRACVLLNVTMQMDAAGLMMKWLTKNGLNLGFSVSPTIAPDGKRASTLRLQPALPHGVTMDFGHVNVLPGRFFECDSGFSSVTGFTTQEICGEFANMTECLPWGAQVLLVLGAEDSAAYTHVEMTAAALDVARRGKIKQVTWCMPLAIRPKTGSMLLETFVMSTAILNAAGDDFASIRLSFYWVPPTIKIATSPSPPTLLGQWKDWPHSSTFQSVSALVAWIDS